MKFFELYGNFSEFETKKFLIIAQSGNTSVMYAYHVMNWVGSLAEN